MSSKTSNQIAQARSFLFVPADRPERYTKALQSGADAVIIDLEDAVAPHARAAARDVVRLAWSVVPASERYRVLLRINAPGSQWHDADVALVSALAANGLASIVVPKVESAQSLATIAAACPGLALLPMIESAQGVAAVDAITRAPQVLRIALGHIDLQVDLGIQCGPDQVELAPLRWALVLASRCAGLAAPVDGVTPAIHDQQALLQDSERSLRCGFGGKLCIHPQQLATVHAAFTPSVEECQWAQRVLDAAQLAIGGACSVDGRMVDAPVIALAQRTLSRHQLSQERN
ncbi:CoA ester lyase [Neisseriaceae bacterium TC5R-5]|nr:CoA ester lyase [Neisseriaceae bacterium TC5R-5]